MDSQTAAYLMYLDNPLVTHIVTAVLLINTLAYYIRSTT